MKKKSVVSKLFCGIGGQSGDEPRSKGGDVKLQGLANGPVPEEEEDDDEEDDDYGLFMSDDEEHHEDDIDANAAQQELVRSKTLEKYTKFVSNKGGALSLSNKRDLLIDNPEKEKSNPDFQKRRLQRAQTLKKNFFDQISKKDKDLFLEEENDCIDDNGFMVVETSSEAPVFNYQVMEQALQESIRQFQATQDAGEVEHERGTVSMMSKHFLNDQEERMRTARERVKKLSPQIKKHISKLSKQLNVKMKENLDGTHGGDFSSGKRHGKLKSKKSSLSKSKREIHKKLSSQEEEELIMLKKELVLMQRTLSSLKLQSKFPKALQWKLRLDAGDSTYVGMKDLEIGQVHAKFEISLLPGGRVRLHVSDIKAVVAFLELSIRGGAKAKMLGGLLTPTINRLDLDITGSWTLEMRPNAKTGVMEEVDSVFKLDLKRKVTGLSVVRLPQSMWQSLSKYLLPKVISGLLRSVIPSQIGTFLLTDFGQSSASIKGNIDIKRTMTPEIWREPLIGPTPAAVAARGALGISEEEAVALDFLCRGERAGAGGFKKRAISLARLFKWRLKYATYSLEQLEPMLEIIQKDSNIPLEKGWFSQIIMVVMRLSETPVDVKVKLTDVDCNDLKLVRAIQVGLEIYVDNFRTMAMQKFRADKAHAMAMKQLASAKQNVKVINHIIDNVVLPMIDGKSYILLNGLRFVGGIDTGFVAADLHDITLQALLPETFNLRGMLPSNKEEHPIQIQGKAGPHPEEYTFQISRDDGQDQIDSELSVRNTQLNLFPPKSKPGTVRLSAKMIKGTIQLDLLDYIIADANQKINEKQQQEQSSRRNSTKRKDDQFLFPETKKLIQESENTMALFRATDGDQKFLERAKKVEGQALPAIIADDSYNVRCDLQGIGLTVDHQDDGNLKLSLANTLRESVGVHFKIKMREVFDLL